MKTQLTDAEMVVLSLVAETARHGYEIEKLIEERGMREWTAIGFSSIYFVLAKLEKAGLVTAQKPVGLKGRKIFSATGPGRKVLKQQTLVAIGRPHPFYPSVLLGMANWEMLKPQEGQAALAERAGELERELARVRKIQAGQQPLPRFVEAIFDYSVGQLKAEKKWAEKTLKTLGESKMEKVDFKKQLKEFYLPSDKKFVVVDVPDIQFVMVDGEGSPDGEVYSGAVQWLFSVIYPIKFIAKKLIGKDFVAPPLEGLWWADDMENFVNGDKDKWKWRAMIATPDWVSTDMFEQALAKAKKKLGDAPPSLRLERFAEGRSVQIMHVGPYSEEGPVIEKMHRQFMPENGLTANGYHHEIYLGDPRRTAPEKLKTVLRQPVRDITG